VSDVERLIRTLKSMDEARVIAAAHALGDLGDRRAVPALVALLEQATSPLVRNAAAVGLRELGDNTAVPALVRQINDPRNAGNWGTFLYALETLDARAAVVDLARVLCSGIYEPMLMALHVLEALPGPLAPAQRARALAVVRHCLATERHKAWQRELLEQALTLLAATPETGGAANPDTADEGSGSA